MVAAAVLVGLAVGGPPGPTTCHVQVTIIETDPSGSVTDVEVQAVPGRRARIGRPVLFQHPVPPPIDRPVHVVAAPPTDLFLRAIPVPFPTGVVVAVSGVVREPEGATGRLRTLDILILPGKTVRLPLAAESPAGRRWAELTVRPAE